MMSYSWWHQVTSSSGRNMAVNFWWASDVANTTSSSCNDKMYDENLKTLKDLKEFKPGEWFRFLSFYLLDFAKT